jgi:hypothetical protein
VARAVELARGHRVDAIAAGEHPNLGMRDAPPVAQQLQDRPWRSDLVTGFEELGFAAAGRNYIPTRRDKMYSPIAFQPDHACGIYRETQESRYAFAAFKSAVSKPSLKRSYTDCRRLRASVIRP